MRGTGKLRCKERCGVVKYSACCASSSRWAVTYVPEAACTSPTPLGSSPAATCRQPITPLLDTANNTHQAPLKPPLPPPTHPPHPQGKGPAAAAVKDILMKLRKEVTGLPPEALAAPRIDRLILIDREVDLVTPLVTQVGGWARGWGLLRVAAW
jgi:hypothetical protein